MSLAVPQVNQQYAIMDGFDDPIFISSDVHPFMSLSNTPSFDADDTDDIDEVTNSALLLQRTLSMDAPIRTSALLDDIQTGEVDQLKKELKQAKQELNEMNETHQSQIKKVKTQSQFLGVLKEQKQRNSMKDLQMNYESELQQINRKLMITQNLHVAEIKRIKKAEIKHKLETKLKDKRIKDLINENNKLITQNNQIQKDKQLTIETLTNEFDQQMEIEVNKRIVQLSQLKKELNRKNNEKNNEIIASHINADQDEKDKLINTLKDKIKKLETTAEKEQDMFFKHTEIMDFKLEREGKERKRIEKKLLQQKVEYETEIKELKQQLSKQNEINIHLQHNIELIIQENSQLKNVHNQVYENIKLKENENEKLRVSVKSNAKTIKELEMMLEKEEDINTDDDDNNNNNINNNNGESRHKYSTSYITHAVDNQVQLEHVGELETIKLQYNKLIDNIKQKHEELQKKYMQKKNELINSQQLLKEIENAKVELATNFAVEMNRIRAIIKKQNKSIRRLSNTSNASFVRC